MRMEHMTCGGSDFVFVSGNYKLQTKARDEWLYVVGDENGRRLTPPALVMGHGRVIQSIDELLRKPLAQAAKLTREEMIAIVMYTGPAFVLYNAVLRQFPADIYNVFKDGNNLFPTTIFVLVSAVNKLSRCMNIPPGTLLYRGLGGTLEFPDRFTRADPNCATPNALGFLEYGFMSTTADKSVAVQYSGVKDGKPRAGILQISPNSVDRGADISEFSQYPAEREFLFVPYSFIQGEGRQRTEVVAGGGVLTVVPVRVNINLKTETTEELKEKKKRLHLVSARAMVEEVRYELGEWAKSAEAAARLQKDISKGSDGATPHILADAIVEQCERVVRQHEATPLEEYVGDSTFRALVSEILDSKAWAKEQKELWMRDSSQLIYFVRFFSLRKSHRLWLSFLQKTVSSAAAGSSERASASLQLLSSRGLALQGLDKRNADGEGVMVQAGADGWQASDITAAFYAGADINATGNDDYNGVANAARFGNANSLATLLSVGGDFNKNNCIYDAAYHGNADCLKLLLEAGGDINKGADSGEFEGASPTYITAFNGHAECLKLLLAAGGDVNKCSNDGFSPIYTAASNGHAECLKLLLAAGGDVNKCSNDGFSPIDAAALNGHAECLKLLLAAGGDVNKCDKDGFSPIYIAALNGHAECLKLLLAAGGDVNKCDKDGFSPISSAAQKGHAECLKLLLAAGGDVNKCNNDGISPIYAAASNGHAECLKLLLAAGGDVNKCDSSGMSPALISLQNGHSQVFEFFAPDVAQQAISQLAIIDAEYSTVVELHRAAGTVVINRHRGFGKLSADYVLQFSNFNTFAADVMLLGGCFYFELQVVEVIGIMQFGFCTKGYEQRRNPQGEGVGDDQYSWAVDGDRSLKWHNGSTNYGSTWAVGDVIGFAVDMRSQAAAVMSISVNGSFAAPNGIAFDNIAAPYLTPAFSATSGQYRVNFGDRPFAYAPIGEQYMSVHAFHKQNQQN
jgi:ankyrin repeat protein